MSDTPSTMLVLLCMTILLYCRVSRRSAAFAAFVFGVSCMFRINNILFLPAIAAIVWLRQPEYLAGVRRTLTNAAAGAGAFLLGFLPQMLANWKFFGSPLKFSYTNYAEGAHTYLHWSFIELNSAFYGTVNQLVWIPGLLSLLFLKDRKLRIILALSYETEFMGDGRKLSFSWRYSFSLNEIMYRYIGFGFILPYEATKQSSSINNCSIIPTESCWARS